MAGPAARLLWAAAAALAGCAVRIPPPETRLDERQAANLILHPERWYGRTVTIRIYPYDVGAPRNYLVCFGPCDRDRAERSSWLIDTRPDRFKGYLGDRPVVVTARFEANCARLPMPAPDGRLGLWCPDFMTGRFTETDRGHDSGNP